LILLSDVALVRRPYLPKISASVKRSSLFRLIVCDGEISISGLGSR
jgi:hypothetical protein